MGNNGKSVNFINVIIWIALFHHGAVTIEGCNVADIQECSRIAPKSQTAEAMCKAIMDLKACFEKALSTCDAQIKAQFSQQLEAQLKASKGMCDQESSCSASEMQKCTKDFPKEMPKYSDISVLCPKLESVHNCFTRMLSGCDNEEMKSNIMSQIQAFSQMKEACDKMSGSGGDGSHTTGGETSDGVSTVRGGCNQAKMVECLEGMSTPPTDKTADAMCKKMQGFMACYDENGKDCPQDLKAGMKQMIDKYKNMMKELKCETSVVNGCDFAAMGKCTSSQQPSESSSNETKCKYMMTMLDCLSKLEECDDIIGEMVDKMKKGAQQAGCNAFPSTTTAAPDCHRCRDQYNRAMSRSNKGNTRQKCQWLDEAIDCFVKLEGCPRRITRKVRMLKVNRRGLCDLKIIPPWRRTTPRPSSRDYTNTGTNGWSLDTTPRPSTESPLRVAKRICLKEPNIKPFEVPVGACTKQNSSCQHEMITLSNGRNVLCDVSTDGGGWIVVQRRLSNTTNFNRNWYDYKIGFGKANESFWMGLQNIYRLCPADIMPPCELRLDYRIYNMTGYSVYKKFVISGEKENYKISIADHSGNYEDFLVESNNKPFTARYRPGPQDIYFNRRCLKKEGGGWWFHTGCYSSTRLYSVNGPMSYVTGILYSEVKVRRQLYH